MANGRHKLESDGGEVVLQLLGSGSAIVVLLGRQSLFTAAAVAAATANGLRSERRIVFDVRDATIVDTATIGIVIAARRHAAEAGLAVAVAAGTRLALVRHALGLAGAAGVVPVTETVADALALTEAPHLAAAG